MKDFGLFVAFDDDHLKQVPVFQSRLLGRGDDHERSGFVGNGMSSCSLARRNALLDGAVHYALARHGGGQLRSDCNGVAPAEMPGAGAGFTFDTARQAAITALLACEDLKDVVGGDVVPNRSDPAQWDHANTAYFSLLRQSEPGCGVRSLTVGGTFVVLNMLGTDAGGAQRLLVGADAGFDEALKQTLTAAHALAIGGNSVRRWSDILPPALGYAPFRIPPSGAPGPSHATTAVLVRIPAKMTAHSD